MTREEAIDIAVTHIIISDMLPKTKVEVISVLRGIELDAKAGVISNPEMIGDNNEKHLDPLEKPSKTE